MEIRPPWPDETARLREFLPRCFQGTVPRAAAVAVQGPAGRLAAAAVRMPPSKAGGPEILRWRLAAEKYRTAALLAPLFAQAMGGAVEAVRTTGFIDEQSEEAGALRALGFVPDAVQEVFELEAGPAYERLRALHERMAGRGLIPSDARVVRLTDERLPAARRLFAQHLSAEDREAAGRELLGVGHAGYRQDHSFVLLVGDEVKGLLLSRHAGGVSHLGAILVAPELRGGHAWANLLLLQRAWPRDGTMEIKTLRFTANEFLHPNSLQVARLWHGRVVGRRVTLLRPALVTG